MILIISCVSANQNKMSSNKNVQNLTTETLEFSVSILSLLSTVPNRTTKLHLITSGGSRKHKAITYGIAKLSLRHSLEE